MADLPTGTAATRAKANTTMRQKLKAKWDKRCKYEAGDSANLPRQFLMDGANFESKKLDSADGENWCRLIDEGVVVDNDWWTGEPCVYAVIRKGTLKKWYESLPDNFVGTIDKDHNRSIDLGKFTKKDLRLVTLENGRYAIDANVKLDHELYAVKDLIRMNNRTALSVEMFVNADEYASAEKVTGDKNEGRYLVPLIDELKIEGYAVCLAPKSANSYKDGLLENAGATDTNVRKDFAMNKDETAQTTEAEETKAEVQTENTTVNACAGDAAEIEAEKTGADTTEDTNTAETTDEAEAGSENTAETTDETEAEKTGADTTTDGEEDKLSAIEAEIKNLKAENATLKEENASLKAQLSAKEVKATATEERLTSILALASADAPASDEDATSGDKEAKSAEVDAYAAAFAELN